MSFSTHWNPPLRQIEWQPDLRKNAREGDVIWHYICGFALHNRKMSVIQHFRGVFRGVQTPIGTNSGSSEVKHIFGVKTDEGQEGLAAALPSVAQSELLPNA